MLVDASPRAKGSFSSISGIIPVMLTPFRNDGAVDYEGLDRLVDWYLARGADALFAVCQSSEMEFLTLTEKVEIARRVVDRVGGRAPVVASGHTGQTPQEQCDELCSVAATGVDAVVLVTNRLDPRHEGEREYEKNFDWLVARLPEGLPLGLYECPSPYRRLLSDRELVAAARSGRFVVLKDVSCDLATIRRRLSLVDGASLAIVNANAAIAFDAMKAGARGFCGVFTNFHPDLYGWLYRNAAEGGDLAEDLAAFLALSAIAENLGYPALAKLFHQQLGTFDSAFCRSIPYDIAERFWALQPLLDIIRRTGDRFRERIEAGALSTDSQLRG
jgi:4-hydroxy-tetrahydrodipicolinate synthase